MTSVSSVGGMPCSFARLIYTPQECPPSQPPRLIAARIRSVQDSETLVTVRNQLSRIFDTEHGGTLSPHAQTFKVFRMHNRTVKWS